MMENNLFVATFSSPIFGDMFLLRKSSWLGRLRWRFSSPIFGDMFLLLSEDDTDVLNSSGFRLLYSEICSYWKFDVIYCCTYKGFRLLYSEICSYSFVTYKISFLCFRFRLLYSEICSYLNFFASGNLLPMIVFVSYIRRYVLTKTN